ncbi:unnamed protein product [Toxocara canis]|uniref:Uncharacterized protein n=1 Tax=Toxocara canis TaxID=6265 RepID=A0A183UE43_TOXCA|nr:unnamed protein product [Toxocara canis]
MIPLASETYMTVIPETRWMRTPESLWSFIPSPDLPVNGGASLGGGNSSFYLFENTNHMMALPSTITELKIFKRKIDDPQLFAQKYGLEKMVKFRIGMPDRVACLVVSLSLWAGGFGPVPITGRARIFRLCADSFPLRDKDPFLKIQSHLRLIWGPESAPG